MLQNVLVALFILVQIIAGIVGLFGKILKEINKKKEKKMIKGFNYSKIRNIAKAGKEMARSPSLDDYFTPPRWDWEQPPTGGDEPPVGGFPLYPVGPNPPGTSGGINVVPPANSTSMSEAEKREEERRAAEIKRLEEREDSAWQRAVADMQKAGLNIAALMGRGTSASAASHVSPTPAQQEEGLDALLPWLRLLMLAFIRLR